MSGAEDGMKRTGLKSDPGKRRAFVERGRRSSASSLGSGSLMKPTGKKPRRWPISPASKEQRAKVAGLPCLGCGREQTEWLAVDPAHVTDRSVGGCDDAACVVPLCRTFDGTGCHRDFEEGRLDLLPLLEHEGRWRVEQAHAVLHLGMARAYRLVTGQRDLAGGVPAGGGHE